MSKVLITSISKKVPLIKAVKDAVANLSTPLKVIGADCSTECIGRYFVDQFWKMPLIDHLSIGTLVDYCKKESVSVIFPTRDGELVFFAKHQEELSKVGIDVMISSYKGITVSNDKFEFSRFCEDSIPTELDIHSLDAAFYVVKERFGAGSLSAGIKLTKDVAVRHAQSLKEPVFQPFVKGKEISVDLYRRKDGVCHGVVCRERVFIVHGESQVTRTFRSSGLEQRSCELANQLDLYGHVMFQYIIEEESGRTFLLECNPRFGGASTASIKAGLDSFRWFLLESGKTPLTPFSRLPHELTMVRHAEDAFFDA